jgi:hypothetical protein
MDIDSITMHALPLVIFEDKKEIMIANKDCHYMNGIPGSVGIKN